MSLVQPRSLVTANSAAKRRVVKDETGTTAAPTASDAGFRTGHHEFLHGTLKSTGGTSFVMTLWGKYDFAEEWFVVDWFGTAGALTATTAAGNVGFEPLSIKGLDAVYAQISTNTGATADVWLGASSFD